MATKALQARIVNAEHVSVKRLNPIYVNRNEYVPMEETVTFVIVDVPHIRLDFAG